MAPPLTTFHGFPRLPSRQLCMSHIHRALLIPSSSAAPQKGACTRLLRVTQCQSTSAKEEGGFNWDFFGIFKPQSDKQDPDPPMGTVTKPPASGAAAGSPKGTSSEQRLSQSGTPPSKQDSANQTQQNGADWEAEQPKADPVGYFIMLLTLLGLLFVTTSIFRYAGHFAAQRRLAREGGRAQAARSADSEVDSKQKAKEQASRRVGATGTDTGGAFGDDELEDMRNVGDDHLDSQDGAPGSRMGASDPTRQQVFVPGSGWVDAAPEEPTGTSRERDEDRHQDQGQDREEDANLQDQDRDDYNSNDDDEHRADNDDDEGSDHVTRVADGNAEELSTKEVIDLAQQANRESGEHVDDAIADKGEDADGGFEGAGAGEVRQAEEGRASSAEGRESAASVGTDRRFNAAQLRERPAISSAGDEASTLPKDASVRSLRQRAAVATRAARQASEASLRASAYSAAASSAASKAASAAERAAEAAGRAHRAMQTGMAQEVKRMEAAARSAEKAARQAEEKAAYPAAHATAHQEVATAQADLADQAAARPVASERSDHVLRAKEWVQDRWYAVKAACGGVAHHWQHWLAAAWRWLQHVWAQVLHSLQQGLCWARQRLPSNLKFSKPTPVEG